MNHPNMIAEFIDVSLLAPPEPMQVILARLASLPVDHYLQIRHSRKPYPLLALLDEQGFNWHFEVFDHDEHWLWIWAKGQALDATQFTPCEIG